jgi:hypothetical protein
MATNEQTKPKPEESKQEKMENQVQHKTAESELESIYNANNTEKPGINHREPTRWVVGLRRCLNRLAEVLDELVGQTRRTSFSEEVKEGRILDRWAIEEVDDKNRRPRPRKFDCATGTAPAYRFETHRDSSCHHTRLPNVEHRWRTLYLHRGARYKGLGECAGKFDYPNFILAKPTLTLLTNSTSASTSAPRSRELFWADPDKFLGA